MPTTKHKSNYLVAKFACPGGGIEKPSRERARIPGICATVLSKSCAANVPRFCHPGTGLSINNQTLPPPPPEKTIAGVVPAVESVPLLYL
jgi:hypothetical protein